MLRNGEAKLRVQSLLAIINRAAQKALDEYDCGGLREVPILDSTDRHPMDSEPSLELRKAVRTLEGACEQLCSSLAPPAHTVVNRGQDYSWSCLRVVCEAKVTDALLPYPGGLHVTKLADTVGLEPQKLARIMRLLASRHIFREVDHDVFANNRLSMTLQSSDPVSDFAKMLTYEGPKAAIVLNENLTDSAVGHSFDPQNSPYMYSIKDKFGGTFFEWQKSQPERRQLFSRAMIGMNQVMGASDALKVYPWKNVRTICDFGGGIGSFSVALLEENPHLEVTLQDLPATLAQATPYWEKELPSALQNRQIIIEPFDFLKESPVPGLDIYYLRNIVHNWPDAEAEKLLKNARAAMSEKSRLIIHDYVLHTVNRDADEGHFTSIGTEMAPEPMLPNYGAGSIRSYNQDITMLFIYNAKERTLRESIKMGQKVGLDLIKVWDLGETSLLEFCPNHDNAQVLNKED